MKRYLLSIFLLIITASSVNAQQPTAEADVVALATNDILESYYERLTRFGDWVEYARAATEQEKFLKQMRELDGLIRHHYIDVKGKSVLERTTGIQDSMPMGEETVRKIMLLFESVYDAYRCLPDQLQHDRPEIAKSMEDLNRAFIHLLKQAKLDVKQKAVLTQALDKSIGSDGALRQVYANTEFPLQSKDPKFYHRFEVYAGLQFLISFSNGIENRELTKSQIIELMDHFTQLNHVLLDTMESGKLRTSLLDKVLKEYGTPLKDILAKFNFHFRVEVEGKSKGIMGLEFIQTSLVDGLNLLNDAAELGRDGLVKRRTGIRAEEVYKKYLDEARLGQKSLGAQDAMRDAIVSKFRGIRMMP